MNTQPDCGEADARVSANADEARRVHDLALDALAGDAPDLGRARALLQKARRMAPGLPCVSSALTQLEPIEAILTGGRVTGDAAYLGVLGLGLGASASELRSAFKKAALRVHPDKNSLPCAARAFQALRTAVDRLVLTAGQGRPEGAPPPVPPAPPGAQPPAAPPQPPPRPRPPLQPDPAPILCEQCGRRFYVQFPAGVAPDLPCRFKCVECPWESHASLREAVSGAQARRAHARAQAAAAAAAGAVPQQRRPAPAEHSAPPTRIFCDGCGGEYPVDVPAGLSLSDQLQATCPSCGWGYRASLEETLLAQAQRERHGARRKQRAPPDAGAARAESRFFQNGSSGPPPPPAPPPPQPPAHGGGSCAGSAEHAPPQWARFEGFDGTRGGPPWPPPPPPPHAPGADGGAHAPPPWGGPPPSSAQMHSAFQPWPEMMQHVAAGPLFSNGQPPAHAHGRGPGAGRGGARGAARGAGRARGRGRHGVARPPSGAHGGGRGGRARAGGAMPPRAPPEVIELDADDPDSARTPCGRNPLRQPSKRVNLPSPARPRAADKGDDGAHEEGADASAAEERRARRRRQRRQHADGAGEPDNIDLTADDDGPSAGGLADEAPTAATAGRAAAATASAAAAAAAAVDVDGVQVTTPLSGPSSPPLAPAPGGCSPDRPVLASAPDGPPDARAAAARRAPAEHAALPPRPQVSPTPSSPIDLT